VKLYLLGRWNVKAQLLLVAHGLENSPLLVKLFVEGL
jgi:hypothetical protein